MAIKKYRIPGLQVPASVDEDEVRAFFNAVKERLELLSGERGDPEQRSVSVRELREAGLIDSTVQNRTVVLSQPPSPSEGGGDSGGESEAEQLDYTLYPPVTLTEANGELQLLVQGVSTNDRFRIALQDFLTLFARLDQESEYEFPLAFRSDTYGFDIIGIAPKFRFTEQSEDSDSESSRPADENVWEIEVDDSELTVYHVNDDDDTRQAVLRLVRSGMDSTAFEYNGSQVLTRADIRTAEVNVGSSPRKSGNFTLADSRIASTSKLLVTLAPGPYTGKGTLPDEAEMYAGIGFAASPGSGAATVYWSAPHRVRGNIKINYVIG